MNVKKDKKFQRLYWYFIGLVVLVCIFLMVFRLGLAVTFSLIFSFVFVFILPGFSVSLLIWPDLSELSAFARTMSSVAISIVLVPLMIFYCNRLVHLPVNRNYVFGELATLSVLCLLLALFINLYSSRKLRVRKKKGLPGKVKHNES